jgi:hypothetical protein
VDWNWVTMAETIAVIEAEEMSVEAVVAVVTATWAESLVRGVLELSVYRRV